MTISYSTLWRTWNKEFHTRNIRPDAIALRFMKVDPWKEKQASVFSWKEVKMRLASNSRPFGLNWAAVPRGVLCLWSIVSAAIWLPSSIISEYIDTTVRPQQGMSIIFKLSVPWGVSATVDQRWREKDLWVCWTCNHWTSCKLFTQRTM